MIEATTFGSRQAGVSYTPRRAAYAVFFGGDGRVAAVRGGQGLFWLPGGGSLPGEAPEDTAVREVREELGRDARPLSKIGQAIQFFHAPADGCHYEMLAVFFLAEFVGKPQGGGEHELCWLPAAEVEESFFPECHAWAVRQARRHLRR